MRNAVQSMLNAIDREAGGGPDLDTAPEVRVPLPAINAAEALDWVLSQIIPTESFEPAPWAEVHAALEKASA